MPAAETKKKRVWKADDAAADTPRGRFASYLHHTSGPLTGFLMGLPLTLIYSVGMAVRGPTAAGDFFTKLQFDALGAMGYLAVQAALTLTFIIALIVLQRKRRFEWRYFGPLLVECTLYAIAVVGLVWAVEAYLGLKPHHSIHPTREAALLAAVGEAVNEETFFRWILVPIVLWLLRKLGMENRYARGVAGLVVSSLIYATVAYFIGSGMGDTQTAKGFLTLWFVGFLFTALFVLRGYTVAAYTHLLYAIYWAFSTPLLT
jgi:hypothetical protein